MYERENRRGFSVQFLALILIVMSSNFVFGQRNENRRIWDSPYGEDRFVISLNNDRWVATPDGVDQRNVSLGFDAHIMYDYKIKKSVISVAWGYGMSSHNVHSNGFFAIDSTQSNLEELVPFDSEYDYKKNKHSATFIEVPIEIRLRTRGENKFKLYLGAKAGYLINYHWKTIDDDGKRKLYKNDNIDPLRYGLTGKIGYNSLSLSVFYSLSPYLKETNQKELIPYSIGISFFLL